jgi:hypothetical protein
MKYPCVCQDGKDTLWFCYFVITLKSSRLEALLPARRGRSMGICPLRQRHTARYTGHHIPTYQHPLRIHLLHPSIKIYVIDILPHGERRGRRARSARLPYHKSQQAPNVSSQEVIHHT